MIIIIINNGEAGDKNVGSNLAASGSYDNHQHGGDHDDGDVGNDAGSGVKL
jgi:hypothetical protein